MGLVPGVALGTVLVKLDAVDCEGWDLFSIIAGREGTRRAVEKDKAEETSSAEQDEQRIIVAKKLLGEHPAVGDCDAALELHRRMSAKSPQWKLSEPMLQQLIALLLSRGDTMHVRPLLVDYIKRFPDHAAPMRVALAEIVLREESRPGQAIAILSHISPGRLSSELERQRATIHKEACQRRDEGELELLGDES
jgi:hypothetical protein